MRSDDLEDALIESLDEHFKDAVRNYVIKESSDDPFLHLVVEMAIYNYFVVRATVEKNTIFFSIIQSGFQLQLLKAPLSDRNLKIIPAALDQEVMLRIPDKYLQAKGW